jgi:hypothetical protein
MKTLAAVVISGLAALLLAGPALAEQAPQGGKPAPPMGGHMMGGSGVGAPAPMGGCPGMSMMGGGMPMMGMMGMMGGAHESPRTMQMHGEMLRAMGDILIKYGKMMEAQK